MRVRVLPNISGEQLQEFFNAIGKHRDRKALRVGFTKHGLVSIYDPLMQSEYFANDYSQMLERCLDLHDKIAVETALNLGVVEEYEY